jgi:hypothetical protein
MPKVVKEKTKKLKKSTLKSEVLVEPNLKTPLKRTRRNKINSEETLPTSSAEKFTESYVPINLTLKSKKSPHIINLKPSTEPYRADSLSLSKVKNQKNPLSSPPKDLPKKSKITGVDFISETVIQEDQSSGIAKSIKDSFGVAFGLQGKPKLKPLSNQLIAEEEEEIEDVFAKPKYFRLSKFYIPRDWHKKVAGFALILIILILPLQAFTYYQNLNDTKDRILLMTNEAIDNLKAGQNAAVNFDLGSASAKFNEARINFASAENEISQLDLLTTELLKLLPGQNQTVKAGQNLIEAGGLIAETGQILSNSGQQFLNEKKDVKDYYQSLIALDSNLKTALDKFRLAKSKIQSLKSSDLPPQHRETFEKVLTYLPTAEQGLADLYRLNSALLKILGKNQWQRYLIIFLNNNELRGSGGFMGSFGLLDIDKGEIKKLDIPGGGTYDLQGSLVPKVLSPEPLHLLNSRWEFQDANWWPDYPTTAKKVEWFYQNANGPSVDGVIMITATMMERLLDIFGPIPMPEYGRDIDSKNFVIETQKIVELEYDKKKNRPKQFIADLAPKLLAKVFSAEKNNLVKLINLLKDGLNQKQLLIYFNDLQVENIVKEFGWAGELKQTDGDFLSVVHTNLAGGKTDGVIKESIQHQAEVQADGSVIDTVKIIRRHTGISGENIFTGVQNNSYIRFYVPLGSTLLEARGFSKPEDKYFDKPKPEYEPDIDLLSVETDKTKDDKTGMDIYKEGSKTVFGNWLQLKPGAVQETTIKYRLPFKLSLQGQNVFYYSFLAQKQPGSLGSDLTSYLKLNDQLKPLAKFPANLSSDDKGVNFTSNLITDQFYGVALVNN